MREPMGLCHSECLLFRREFRDLVVTHVLSALHRQDEDGTLYYVLDYTARAVAPGSGNWFRHNLSVYAARCAHTCKPYLQALFDFISMKLLTMQRGHTPVYDT